MTDLPEPIKSQVAALLARRDLETERARADRMLVDSNKLYELRGWLRLCEDTPAGHEEFYGWASHYLFDAPPPTGELSSKAGQNDEPQVEAYSPPGESSHPAKAEDL